MEQSGETRFVITKTKSKALALIFEFKESQSTDDEENTFTDEVIDETNS